MAQFFNHNSFVITAVVVWAGLALFLLRHGFSRRAALALAVVGSGFAASWLALRSGPGAFAEAAQVEAAVGQGQPVLLEFYSNY